MSYYTQMNKCGECITINLLVVAPVLPDMDLQISPVCKTRQKCGQGLPLADMLKFDFASCKIIHAGSSSWQIPGHYVTFL